MGWIDEYVHAGMTCLDLGANAGTYTEAMRDRGARVWAIEPDPRCHAALQALVPPEQVLRLAVGDTVGMTTLYRSRRAEHNSLFAPNVLEQHHEVPDLEVPVSTLDALQAEGRIPERIDLIKCDVQGAEAAVWRGASRLIATQQPWWFLELWPGGLQAAGTSAEEVLAQCEAAGYAPVDRARSYEWIRHHLQHMTGHGSYDVLLRPVDVAIFAA